jgi:GMP synthase-like glutamine amidotransferase
MVLTDQPLRVHYLQHMAHEGPWAIAEWCADRGHAIRGTHVYQGHALPSLCDFDVLVILGGAMSVNDTDRLPWLEPETRLIDQAIDAGKAVYGACLGAQFMAKALGARVYPMDKEIGWWEVRRTEPDNGVFRSLPARFTALQWHGEAFDLPAGARRLAFNEACTNQGFQYGPRAIGMQCHLEATPGGLMELVTQASGFITGGRYQQSPATILHNCRAKADAMHPILYAILDYLVQP